MLKTGMALLLLLCPIAVSQTANRTSDCSTLKYSRHKVHKVSCLCGTVQICSGDICGPPSVYELDDDVSVELRDKSGTTLDTQKAVVETSEVNGTTQDGSIRTIKLNERRFSFDGKQDGDYLLAFILHKNGAPQPALLFPTMYSHKSKNPPNSEYMLEPICPR